jgi:Icc-related predicted phosphoesterase
VRRDEGILARTRIFFASDVHGSERTFLKFVNAGRFYKADIIMLGGDITGKMIIPIVESADGSHSAKFLGSDYNMRTTAELEELEKSIRYNGYYPYRTNPIDKEELDRNPSKVDELFSRLMVEGVERWVRIAEERLKGTGMKCFILPGNDDRIEVDSVLEKSSYVICPEGKVTHIDDHHEMIATGYGNITPWHAPRDIPEEELAAKIEAMTRNVENAENCIFMCHCPPYNTGIDLAPKLDERLRIVLSPTGGPEMIPAGSTAVRDAIEKHQPLLGLHGHIHESKGFYRLSRTLCLNPGSEYSEGILRGALVALDEKKVQSYVLTRG